MSTIKIKKLNLVFIGCFGFMLSAVICAGQEKRPINLSTALELAGANNVTIAMLSMEEALAQAKYEAQKNWWIPDLQAGLDMHQLWGNTVNSDGRVFTDVEVGSFSGALGLNALFDFAEGSKNKNLAKYRMEGQVLRSKVSRNEYILEVIRQYYTMMGANLEAESYARLVGQNDSIIDQIKTLVDAGLQYNTDLLLARSNRENHIVSFSAAIRKLDEAQFSLIGLLNLQDVSSFELEGDLVPLDLNQEEKDNNSIPEIELLENRLYAKTYEYKAEKNSIWIPTVRLNAYTSLFGGIFDDIDPTHAINGGIGWNIPLRRLTGDDMRVLSLEKDMIYEEIQYQRFIVDNETQSLKNELGLLEEHINSAEKAVQYSIVALSETGQRQSLGLARPFEIVMAQESFIRSRINYILGVVEYNIKQYELYVRSGNNL